MAVLGLDVGGADLKAAHTCGFTRHLPFALWKKPAGLADELQRLLATAPPHDALALTMTGELCDCFASKRQGVGAILDAVAAVSDKPCHVFTTDGTFTDLDSARARPLQVASANWLALAAFAGRLVPAGPAVLIDVGTTTTDVIPLFDGRPVPRGLTDPERLRSGELVYRGWRRTPLCALLAEGAAEWFATTHDVYLVLNQVPEDAGDRNTADGQPATRSAAHRRLARMLCADLETTTQQQREELALLLHQRLVLSIRSGLNHVIERLPAAPGVVIGSGSGEFLLGSLSAGPIVSLTGKLGQEIATAACAFAVAVLCAERVASHPQQRTPQC